MLAPVRTILTGSVEYLDIEVECDFTLDAQPVAISFDRTEWLTAAWVGAAGTARTARLLLNADNMPAKGWHQTYVKVTDNPEIPVIETGVLEVK